MLRASWKSLLGRKLRLVMSAFAIILGVSFVAGSLIFTDTLGRAFTGIMSGTVGDVVVRPTGATGDDGTQTSRTLPASLVSALAATPGAARADGNITNFGTFVVTRKNKLIGGQGAPGIGVNYSSAPAAHGTQYAALGEGRWPTRSGEVAVDERTVEKAGYRVGQDIRLVSSGAEATMTARLVGTVTFAGGSLAGASVSVFDTATAQRLFTGGQAAFNDAWVTAGQGTSQEALRAAVAARLPAGYEAVTGDTAADEAASDITSALSFISTFLLVFAGIALVVGSFLIVNTFSILVAQRSRELALLRALGAGRRQVARSVLFEAFVVGLVGSTLGLGLGFVLATGIKALFGQLGLDLTGAGLVFAPRTALAAYGVGLVVTLVAAYLPARRAGQVSPVAAMRDDVALAEGSLHRRVLVGGVMIVLGAGAMALGLLADVPKPVAWIGGGIFGVVLGTALTSPLVGRPVIALLGAVYRRLFGAVGVMAEQNAVRNPRRTAATASALMIGLALVSMMAVFGASAKASIDAAVARDVVADYVVSNAVGTPFSPAVADQISAVPGVAETARFRYVNATHDGDSTFAGAVDADAIGGVIPLTASSGRVDGLSRDTVLVSEDEARSQRLSVGQKVRFSLAGVAADYTVGGIYAPSASVPANLLFSIDALDAAKVAPADSMVYVTRDPAVAPPVLQQRIEKVIADLPTVTLKDQAAYAAEQRAPIDQLLYMIYALLGLAVVIAVLGIVNTLALSVIERTREIGLLRAVGLSRRQLRTMLRLESVVIAVLGAALGVGLGLVFGISLQRALADDGIDVLSVPLDQLAIFVALAGLVGVLAAVWPGRRAANLDVLRAITTE